MPEPTEVYIVTRGIYSDYKIVRVFLDRAQADEYAKIMTATDEYACYEHEVEVWPIGVPAPTYEASDFAYQWTPDEQFEENYDRHQIPEGAHTHVVERSPQRVIVAGKSEEHVRKVIYDEVTRIKAEQAGIA
ncbi:hypothetical protein FK268_12725 [Tsukamurella sputi]|uniref:Uncharacterized protein n=1 Tax=Tsukamurella sputi TaxID=2591848 RepID=A0A5C5RKG3_9ACTN|nr:hypothetical protein [Tsukamurella sputi]TWS23178.1 hypothetical protein FK268_12725 [Tsukamurella sputi]